MILYVILNHWAHMDILISNNKYYCISEVKKGIAFSDSRLAIFFQLIKKIKSLICNLHGVANSVECSSLRTICVYPWKSHKLRHLISSRNHKKYGYFFFYVFIPPQFGVKNHAELFGSYFMLNYCITNLQKWFNLKFVLVLLSLVRYFILKC